MTRRSYMASPEHPKAKPSGNAPTPPPHGGDFDGHLDARSRDTCTVVEREREAKPVLYKPDGTALVLQRTPVGFKTR